MARYRIIQYPGCSNPTKVFYEVQKRVWLFWNCVGTCQTLRDAEEFVRELKAVDKNPIKRKVVRVFD